MHLLQELILETLRRIQIFLETYTALLGTVNQSAARERLDATVTQMTSHAVDQVAGRRSAVGETAKQRSFRMALRNNNMQPIAKVAGLKLREQPEFKDLRMPPWNVKGARLTAAATDMANAAEKYTDLFLKEGLPTDFVAQLRTATTQLDQSIDVRGKSRGQQVGATSGLKAQASQARALISVIDAIVRPQLGTNDQLLREWEFASHIERPRTASAKASTSTPAGSTSTPASTTTPSTVTTASTTAHASTSAAAPAATPAATAAPIATPESGSAPAAAA
jgi:hypothetical protein